MGGEKIPRTAQFFGRGRSLLVVSPWLIFLVAINLRAPITSVGPLLGQIGESFGLGESALGFLGAAPLLAFAIFSPLASRLAAKFGIERTILGALAIIVLGILVRSYTGLGGLLIGTVIIGLGIATGNVLVPAVVKRDYSGSVALATAIYTSCMTVTASVASGVAVPIANHIEWRGSLALWALPAMLVIILWLPRALRAQVPRAAASPEKPKLPLHKSRDAWMLTLFMGLQSTSFYIMVTWLPTIAVDGGASETQSGTYLLGYQLVGLFSGFVVPIFMKTPSSQVKVTVGVSVPIVICIAGILLFPQLILLWALIGGIGSGAALVVALSLISLRGQTPEETAQLSGMAQSLGYLMASGGPIAAGFLAEMTGTWSAPLIALAILCLLQVAIAVPAGRPSK